jgi:translation elongation factor EF-Tu-like GTPase
VREDWFRIEADLRLLRTDEGGRRGAVASGYRPNCWFGLMLDGDRLYNDCLVTLIDGETFEHDGDVWVNPGDRCRAMLHPAFPQYVRDVISIGFEFEVCEGRSVVAHGTVLSVFDPGPEHD